ncbi:MAG: FtsX-like permease family protein [Candidatus Hermodarchaeota archaeon]
MTIIPNFFHRGGLMIQFSRLNLKLTVISLIGLTIGLSMISAALFQLDSTRADFYFTTLEKFQDDLNFEIDSGADISATMSDAVVGLKDQIDLQIAEYNLTSAIQLRDFWPYSSIDIGSFLYYNHTSVAGSTDIYGVAGLNESILLECTGGSRLPRNLNEVLVFVENLTATPISLNDQVNITQIVWEGLGSEPIKHNFTLTAVGLATPSTLVNNSILQSITRSKLYGLITSLNSSFSLAQSMATELNQLYDFVEPFQFSTNVYFSYVFDLTAVTRENVFEVKENIFKLDHALSQFHAYGDFWVGNDLRLTNLESEFWNFDQMYSRFMFISLPVFIVAALLVSLSLELINEKRHKALALLKIRGVSNRFVFLIMFLEILIIALCGALLALGMGIPLALLLGSSTGMLVFTKPAEPSKLLITPEAIQSVFFMSLFLTFLIHFPSLARIANSKIVSLSEEAEKKSGGKIQVIVAKVDLVFLLLGSVGVILVSILIDFLRLNPTGQVIVLMLLPFVGLFLLAPLVFLIGFFSTFNRFIPKLIHKLGEVSWHRDWRLLAISTRNLQVSTKIIGRTTLLIAITLALLVIFSVFSLSFHYYNVDNAFYDVGAEISFSMSQVYEENFEDIVADLKTVTGFSFTTVKEWSVASGSDGLTGPSLQHFMGIEADFAQVAHWQAYYAAEPLESLVATLFDSTASNSVIVDSKTMAREQLTIGGSYLVDLPDRQIPVTIQAATNYWPRLNNWVLDSFFITKAAYAENITITPSRRYYYTNTILGKILSDYNKTQIISAIQEIIRYRSRDPSTEVDVVYNHDALQEASITNIFLWFFVNANLLAELIIIISVLTLFGTTRTLRQTREIALSRSLGMKFPQVFRLIFTETFLLFVLSGLPGGFAGGVLVMVIIAMIGQFPLTGAPFTLQIDVVPIIGSYILIFVIIVFVGFVTSLLATRTNISKILKVE